MNHLILDTEIVGKENPTFLVCGEVVETGKKHTFWGHNDKHMAKLYHVLKGHTVVTFNGNNFDAPLLAAAMMGHASMFIKQVATDIVETQARSWQTYKKWGIEFFEFDHIDLIEVAPGVMISLKTYAGRMGYKTMVDMPVHHDTDLTPEQYKLLIKYCQNDVGVTKALFHELKDQRALRQNMSEAYGMDLRSKSDAQIAEVILKKQCGIARTNADLPLLVRYKAPALIRTDHPGILELIELLEKQNFKINPMNGSPVAPDFLKEPFRINEGYYQCGIGGLHSTHDTQMCLEADEDRLLSDFDVVSYYPNIMLRAGLTPHLSGGKGQVFIDEYRHIYDERMKAKAAGNKVMSNSLKIMLNGTFGKLGSMYCSFYAPELMLAVTITGQLNLLCLIVEIEKIKGVRVRSANTDGILVDHKPSHRTRLLKVIAANAKRTGFEYEETPYIKYAAKDVNNYLAITAENKVKRKGLYGEGGVFSPSTPGGKNPTMEVCTQMAIDYLKHGRFNIYDYNEPKDFMSVRNVKGGGVQHTSTIMVNDWEEVAPKEWAYPCQITATIKRKSPPPPREVGIGGVPFGRVARWYMTTQSLPCISYVSNGNKVPKTDGAKLCLTLPSKLPKDLDRNWYISETNDILRSIGLKI